MKAKSKPIWITAAAAGMVAVVTLWTWREATPQPQIPIVPGHQATLSVDHDAPGHMKPKEN